MISVILPVKLPEPYLDILLSEIHGSLSNFPHEIFIQTEKGFGYAVQCGVEKSRGNVIVVMDSDGSHSPSFLPEMIKALSTHDIVIGSRYVGEGCTYDNTFFRKKLSSFYNKLTKWILGVKIHDSMSGFIVARKDVFNNYKFPHGYKFMLPLYFQNPKYKILEFPIVFHKRKAGKSKTTFVEGFKIMFQILLLRLRRKSIGFH